MRYEINLMKAKNALDRQVISVSKKVSRFANERVLNAYDRSITRTAKCRDKLMDEMPISYQLTDEGEAAATANLHQALEPYQDASNDVTQ